MADANCYHTIANHAQFVRSVLDGDRLARSAVDEVTLLSWQRCCVEFGLDPGSTPDATIISRSVLQERQQNSCHLLEIARPEMTNLYQQLAGSGHAIMLTDRDGVVLNYIGDPDFTDTAAHVGIQTGAVWSEAAQGTNGMGTCLVEKKPIVIHKTEHFFTRNASLTCAAAPIFDPNGEVLAILDASSEARMAQQHTMVLLNMSAQVIENRVFFCAMKAAYVLRFHSRSEFISTMGEGAIAFTPEGKILAVNRSAIFQLGLGSPDQVVGRPIHELFTISLPMLLKRAHTQGFSAFPLREEQSGRRFFAKVQPPESTSRPAPAPVDAWPQVDALADQDEDEPFRRLHFGDPRMKRNIETVKKVLGRDIPYLLIGETGTGKDVFAKAIHRTSARGDRPFVAVNCASLPEALIESELFGYRPGAFTGARREGSRGRIAQADGGTLFLDEIGDMPLHLQARLLRVLEEREVVPLGGEKPVPVSIQLISATHRDVQALIAEGKFRDDLYYRINGISIVMPKLRERADKRQVIQNMANEEAHDAIRVEWGPGALELLERFEWPGNLRQLRNVLRTATALCQNHRITFEDFPDQLRNAAPDANDLLDDDVTFNALDVAERDALLRELEGTHWNVSRVAKNLGLSRNTLYRRMKRYGISPSR